MQDKRVDLAIVGAGFSGPILAAKIAEKGVKPGNGEPLAIALIDAGPYYKEPLDPVTALPSDAGCSPIWRAGISRLTSGTTILAWPRSWVEAPCTGPARPSYLRL